MYEAISSNRGGISTIVATLLLLGIVVASATYLAGFMSGFMKLKSTPNIQLAVQDCPDPLNSGCSFIIRHIGGDSVRFDDLMVVVYDSSGKVIYSGVVSSGDFTLDQISSSGHNSVFFEVGEQIMAKNSVVSREGVYEISIYYTPTNSLICNRLVSIT